MKALLLLPKIKVESANAISGITYGFPAITHFLGFTHALSRDLKEKCGVTLGGCAVVSHKTHVRTRNLNKYSKQYFSLTRNPLVLKGKKAESAPFNEEGKVNLEVSLIIECNFTSEELDFNTDDDNEDVRIFCELIQSLAEKKRLAGGYITEMKPAVFVQDKDMFRKKVLRNMMPGFILRDRTDVLEDHLSKNPDLTPLDVILDFYTHTHSAALKGSYSLLLVRQTLNHDISSLFTLAVRGVLFFTGLIPHQRPSHRSLQISCLPIPAPLQRL